MLGQALIGYKCKPHSKMLPEPRVDAALAAHVDDLALHLDNMCKFN